MLDTKKELRHLSDEVSKVLTFQVKEFASGLATLAIVRRLYPFPGWSKLEQPNTTIESHEDWESAFDQYVFYVEEYRNGRRDFPCAADISIMYH